MARRDVKNKQQTNLAALLALLLVSSVSARPETPGGTAPKSAGTPTRASGKPTAGVGIDRYLNIRSAGGPRFAPSGKRLAFSANITGQDQVWTIDSKGGWPDQLTFGEEPVNDVAWSPSSESVLLFSRDVGGNERDQLFLTDLETGLVRRLTRGDDAIHNFGDWTRDGRTIAYRSNERNTAFFDVYTIDVGGGEAKRVYQQDGTNAPVAFSPDGRWLLISRSESSFENNLFLVDTRGDAEPVLLTPHEGLSRYEAATWRPDGKGFYLLSDEGRDFMNLASYDLAARRLKFLEDVKWDLEDLAQSQDGRILATVANIDGAGEIHLRDTRSGAALSAPPLPKGVPSALAFSKDGGRLAFSFSGPRHPSNVWLWDVRARKLSQVTNSSTAGIPTSTFVPTELVHYKTFDGRSISAFLYRPQPAVASGSSRGERVPMVVNVHGGPEGQSRPLFSALTQYLVGRGFGVIYPNVRGSTGYGNRFSHLDDVERRLDSVRDLAECAKWLVSSGIAPEGKVAVIGGSYGGYMTLAALTFHPDLWACGVDIVGISNLRTFIANTGAWRRKLRAAEYGDPEKDGEVMDKASPFNLVDRIRAPLMVIQGANDPRVPQSEAEQMVEAIRKRGGAVEYLLFPDEGHGLEKLPNRIKGYTQAADFLEKHLLGA